MASQDKQEKRLDTRFQELLKKQPEINKDAGIYYGKIDFLGAGGIVGETIYYKDKQSFDKEVYESGNIGRPIDCHVYEHPKKPSIAERITASKERSTAQKQDSPEKDRKISKEREIR